MPIHEFRKAQDGKDFPAVKLTKKNPLLAAAVAKMTESRFGVPKDSQGNRRLQLDNTHSFKTVLQKRAKRNADARSIMQLLPDTELSAQILVSSILSPKDMTTIELLFMGPKDLVSPELSAMLLVKIKEHFDDVYKIKPLLTQILREALVEKGSYPVAVIPENAIDDFINSDRAISTESLKDFVDKEGRIKSIGILGPHTVVAEKKNKVGLALESHYTNLGKDKINANVHYLEDTTYTEEKYLSVTDNPAVLKLPRLNEKTKKQAVMNVYAKSSLNIAAESISDTRVERAIYRTRSLKTETVADLKKPHELKRKSVGGPLVMKLPSESVIPVHVPGNLKQHIGYFVVLDEEGNPIEVADGDEYHSGLSGAGDTSLSSNLIKRVQTNMLGNSQFDPNNSQHIDFASKIYADMVERDLISRVKNGVYSQASVIAKNEDVYRIMLARVLAKKFTQILYIPIEYMTYIAFKYTDDGVGRSLLDDTSIINTIRTVLMFADVTGSVKNSIGRTKVSMVIPEHDPNWQKTVEMAQDEIVRSRMIDIPLGTSSIPDITNYIQRAGYEWEFTGGKGIPELKFDFEQKNSTYQKSDNDLQENLKKASIQAFGLSPETVENGFNTEFATTAVANNILLNKRVTNTQDEFTPQLSDHLRKIASSTSELVDELRIIILDNIEEILFEVQEIDGIQEASISEEYKQKVLVSKCLMEFLNGWYVELPRPSSVTLENQVTDLKGYMDALDAGLDAYFSADMFTEASSGDAVSSQMGMIKASYKAYFTRDWLNKKGILPELAEMMNKQGPEKAPSEVDLSVVEHIRTIIRQTVTTMASLKPMVDAVAKDAEAIGITQGDGSGDSFDSSSSDTGNTDDGFGDFGIDDPADETPQDEADGGAADDITIPSEADEKAEDADKESTDTDTAKGTGPEDLS